MQPLLIRELVWHRRDPAAEGRGLECVRTWGQRPRHRTGQWGRRAPSSERVRCVAVTVRVTE